MQNCSSEIKDIVLKRYGDTDYLEILVDSAKFNEDVLDFCLNGNGDIHKESYYRDKYKKNVIIEFGSPNIAKPFHIGHLRSAIIGNVVANLKRSMGHYVTTINYLGDWGTQFGLLQVGYEKHGNKQHLLNDPMSHLSKIYAEINNDAQKDPSFTDRARKVFSEMENDRNHYAMENWKMFRELSIKEYERMYKRIGVKFDSYDGESMYSKQSTEDLIETLSKMNLLVESNETGQKVVMINQKGQEKAVPLVKNDGSLLYVTRDIAAALDRKKRYNFDEMIYVVDKTQAGHFNALFDILHLMGKPWSQNLHHVKFGRIAGMSSRRGNAVILDNILNESKFRALKAIESSKNVKIGKDELEEVSESLGVAAVIINDLKNKLVADITFEWEEILHQKHNSGVSIQYSHARLYNLQKNCGVTLTQDIDFTCLSEPEAVYLLLVLAKYYEVILKTEKSLEPRILVLYIFELCHASNKAIQKLKVKGENQTVAEARLRMFFVTRHVLAESMKLLGIKPLNCI
ncbi:putative arginine--tRNA ligase, mitochondrial [Nymphon striatum]|nr:putative arginine--tRNA ligase, mitochondrial [Nymphon striatum]